MNSDELTKDLTEDLMPDAPDTNPLLKELLSNFREFRAETRARWARDDEFQFEVLARLAGVEAEQRLIRLELKAVITTQRFREAKIESHDEMIATLKAA